VKLPLPEVAGRYLTVSHAQFEQSIKVLMAEEQDKPSPNNALVSVLCEAIRLSREHVDVMTRGMRKSPNPRRKKPPFTPSVPLTMCGHLHAKVPGE